MLGCPLKVANDKPERCREKTQTQKMQLTKVFAYPFFEGSREKQVTASCDENAGKSGVSKQQVHLIMLPSTIQIILI